MKIFLYRDPEDPEPLPLRAAVCENNFEDEDVETIHVLDLNKSLAGEPAGQAAIEALRASDQLQNLLGLIISEVLKKVS